MSETMMVADALRRIATLKGQLGEQRKRAAASISWTENTQIAGSEERPAFDAKVCMTNIVAIRKELVLLQAAVYRANEAATIEWDHRSMSVTEAVRWREEYKSEIAWLKGLNVQAQPKMLKEEFGYDDESHRVRVTKAHHCALPEAERTRLVDEAQVLHDRVNLLIEKCNRKTPVRSIEAQG